MKVDCWACYNNINEEDRYKAHNLEKKSLMDVSGHSPFINNNKKRIRIRIRKTFCLNKMNRKLSLVAIALK